DFRLTGRTHLVVMDLDLHTRLLQLQHDLAAQVLQLIHRWNREIAFLVARAVPEVRGTIARAIPDALFGIDLVKTRALVLTEADRVEDVELDLRTKIGGRGDATLGQERFSFFRDVPRIARIALATSWLDDITDDGQRRDVARRIEKCRVGVRQKQHV